MKLRDLEPRSARVEKRLQVPLLVAAVLTIPTTIVQASDLGSPWTRVADVVNGLIWAVFLAEVVIMLAVVPSKRRWLRDHPLELTIVVLTNPFLSAAFQSLRVLRLLRVFRLLRLAPLIRRLMSAEGLRAVAALAALTAFAGGAAFAGFEKVSFGDGIYWAVTTMTTVGYGDFSPKTSAGKVVAVVVMLVGIGTATLVIGAVAQRFTAAKVSPALDEVQAEEEDVLAQVREIATRLQQVEALLERQRSPS